MILTVIMLVSVSCAKTPVPPPTPPPVSQLPSTNTPAPRPPGEGPPGTLGLANDDIVTPPGGFGYRANVHQAGQPDWPPVQQTEVQLWVSPDLLFLTYRDQIETKAGETRNNIFYLDVAHSQNKPDPLKASYEVKNLPQGFSVVSGQQMYGGIGGQNKLSSRIVMKITIAAEVIPGEYPFEFKVVVDGVDFGNIPCTVKVMK